MSSGPYTVLVSRRTAVAAFAALMLSACISPPGGERLCDVGYVCPAGSTCDISTNTCTTGLVQRPDSGTHAATQLTDGGPQGIMSPADGGPHGIIPPAGGGSTAGGDSPCPPANDPQVRLDLVNHCTSTVAVHLVRPGCADLTTTLLPGKESTRSAPLGADFVITDANTGESLRAFPGLTESATVTLCRKLLHHWAFEANAEDSAGGRDAVLVGATLGAHAVNFSGNGAYATLPIGDTIGSLATMTIEVWATHTSTITQQWARIFDFGTSSSSTYMFFAPQRVSGTKLLGPHFAMTRLGKAQEEVIAPAAVFPIGELTQVVVTIDGATHYAALYIDGRLVTQTQMELKPSDLGQTPNNFLGKSQYPIDPYFVGSIEDLRIYNDVLSASDVKKSWSAGPRATP